MSESIESILEESFRRYLIEKVGERKADEKRGCFSFSRENLMYLRACEAASELDKNYDAGIAIGTDGFYTGFIAREFDFPVFDVRASRRGRGATWQLINDIAEKDLKDKRVIVFDNDVLTGRTLKRASREIQSYNPDIMDVLLMYEKTPITVNMYMKGNAPKGLPNPHEILNKNWKKSSSSHIALGWKVSKEGIQIDYLKEGKYPEIINYDKTHWIAMHDTRTNIPKCFDRIKTLEGDYEPNVAAAEAFENRFLNKYNVA